MGEDGDVGQALVDRDVIDKDFENERNGHGGEGRAGDGRKEEEHRPGVAPEHDAVFREELFAFAFEDMLAAGGGGVFSAGGGEVKFDGRVGIARGIEEAFADLVAELSESLATGLHSVNPHETRSGGGVKLRGIVAAWKGRGRDRKTGANGRKGSQRVRGEGGAFAEAKSRIPNV
jgi:hypothetical protein